MLHRIFYLRIIEIPDGEYGFLISGHVYQSESVEYVKENML